MHASRPALRLAAAALFTATLGAALGQPAQTPTFGRLFHTPSQRIELERLRNQPPPAAGAADPVAPQPTRPPQLIDGILRRSDGYLIVWLDGEALALPPGLRLAPGPALTLIPEAAPRQRLHVGDRWQASSTPAAPR